MHDVSFAQIFESFLAVAILKTNIFKSSVLFGIHTLLNN